MHIAKLLYLKPEMNFLDHIGNIKKFTSLNNLFYAKFCWLGYTNILHTGIGNRISSSLCCKAFALLAWVLQEICSNSEFPVSSVYAGEIILMNPGKLVYWGLSKNILLETIGYCNVHNLF